ncbi:MAG: cysteine--tRNA ligase [Eubacteriales bacterium]
MKLYNTATRQKEDFVPREENFVSLYTCGPTVYHFAHIGNLRSYLMEDILEKYLRFSGYSVKRVMNITDVGHLTSDGDTGEDKMLSGAKREKKSVLEIAQFYTDAFFQDCDKLSIKRPDVIEKATDCVPEYLKIIQTLLDKGNAYEGGGNIYFDTSSIENYHVFHNHQEEDLDVGVRDGVEQDENKKNKADFVLWFTKSKFDDQELKWDSPWGVGYPGWHMECTGIALKHLGEHLDIHCGGVDNAFPHHTNEIAQSEAYLGHAWCKHWVHVAHLNIQTGKMSKSSGEFLTVSLLEEKGYDPLAYRFFCLQSHYRKSLLFSWETLDNAVLAYEKFLKKLAKIDPDDVGTGDTSETAAPSVEIVTQLKEKFHMAMGNDLNTAQGMTVVYEVQKAKICGKSKWQLLQDFDQVLGLSLWEKSQKLKNDDTSTVESKGAIYETPEDLEIQALVEERDQMKKEKNFARSDEIRDLLKERGIVITDTAEGGIWKRA